MLKTARGGPGGPVLELQGVTKRFGQVVANDSVDLRVERGTIHGIIGENGAGKSTAMKLLYGMCRPEAGSIMLEGKRHSWASPADAIAAGIGMVHQHFMLAGTYSGLDNIVLGVESVRYGLIDRSAARNRLVELARKYGLPVDLDQAVEQLPVGVQQRIEILKLLYREANVLILDEPTAVLIPQEVQALFANLKKFRDEGKTILLVTHKLKEAMAITDRVTVFRSGRAISDLETSKTNAQELANLMVGRPVSLNLQVGPGQKQLEPALDVAGLTLVGKPASRPRLSEINFRVHGGEILGIAGVDGNGQSELLEAILHPRDPRCRSAGTVRVLGQDVSTWPARRIRELGVAVVPQDRLREGLLVRAPVSDNFLLGLQRDRRFSRKGWLQVGPARMAAAQALEEYDVRPRDLALPAGKLSGGNQQKLIMARELERHPQLIIAAQPTRGVDVGAIEFIHRRLVQARDQGAGVLLVSFELEELLALSDRLLVLFEGRIVAEFSRGTFSELELGLKMGGG